MEDAREELIEKIEEARKRLNDSIDSKEQYENIYRNSIELDELLNRFVTAKV